MTKQEINDAKEVAELPLVSQPSANSNSKDRVSLNYVTDHMPEHLRELFSQTMKGPPNEHLTVLGTLLIEYQDIFAQHDLDIGCLKALKHKIDTGSAAPVKQRMRRTPIGFEAEEKKHLDKMLKAGIIRPSESDWASAPVLVRKKDGSVRWCIDYRALNDKTIKDQYPLPLIDDCLDTLAGTVYFSTLDLASGYYQIELEESSMKKTAFVTKYGLFEHVRMGFGLCNAPATFMRAMNLVLRGLTWSKVLVYLDDIIVLGNSFEEHIQNLKEVFDRMRHFNLKRKPKKCALLREKVEFLGRSVSRDGISITSSKMDAIENWPEPTCKKEVESFLGYCNYHRAHIRGYAGLTVDLYELTKKSEFSWTDHHRDKFKLLKEALRSAPCLAFPLREGKFVLDCDASDQAIGAELSQIQNGVERLIGYHSLVLLPQHKKYCTTRKELLAVVRFCVYYRNYLLGRQFLVRTDHNSLAWLTHFRHIEGQLARWLEVLAQFDFQIIHRPGNKHSNADALSRIPDRIPPCNCYEAGTKLEDLPCGGCHYCTRAHNQWERFDLDFDDVVPIAVRHPLAEASDTGTMARSAQLPSQGDESQATGNSTEKKDFTGLPLFKLLSAELPALDTGESDDSDDNRSVVPSSPDHDDNNNQLDLEVNWMANYSPAILKQHQMEDKDLQPILNWLEEEDPTPEELYLCSPTTKALWLHKKQLQTKNGVLYYSWEDPIEN